MRSFFVPLVLVFFACQAQADLTCFVLASFSFLFGNICHFAPDFLNPVENATINSVEAGIQTLNNAVNFTMTHNPVSVTYNYVTEAAQHGFGSANGYLGATIEDFENVTIGFAKETNNQAVQLYSLTHWNDVVFCIMTGTYQLFYPNTSKRRRAAAPTASAAQSMVANCLDNRIYNALTFNITDPNQQIGSTFSDIAGLFVPVDAEAEAGIDVAGQFDIAVPGSEDATRIMKQVPGSNVAEHFADADEAQSVADSMQDKDWRDENCKVCELPFPTITARRSFPARANIKGRGLSAMFGACCGLPPSPVVETDVDIPDIEAADNSGAPGGLGLPVYNVNLLYKESDLVPPPDFIPRDIIASLQALKSDLDTYNTGVVEWSSPMTEAIDSTDLFSLLRKIFTGPTDDPLYKALAIKEKDGTLRMTSRNVDWVSSDDPVFAKIQTFYTAALEHGKNVIEGIRSLENLPPFADLEGEIEFFYTAPSETALTGTDRRGFHVDQGLMQFGAADTPGLVVENFIQKTASRVPVQDNAFYLLKAMSWDLKAWLAKQPNGATEHAVFGPEMAKSGRVSMIMSVFKPMS